MGGSVLVATTGGPEECRTALQGTGDYEPQSAVCKGAGIVKHRCP